MTNNIYLTGFMGCGKSTIGFSLSKLTGKKFIDLDKFIVAETGRSIEEIFETDGEEFFRRIETDALSKIAEMKNLVVALGGGTVLTEQNAEICRKTGKTVFLQLSFETSYERIKSSGRPLVVNHTKEELRGIFEQRLPLYTKHSSVHIDADNSPFILAKEIKKRI